MKTCVFIVSNALLHLICCDEASCLCHGCFTTGGVRHRGQQQTVQWSPRSSRRRPAWGTGARKRSCKIRMHSLDIWKSSQGPHNTQINHGKPAGRWWPPNKASHAGTACSPRSSMKQHPWGKEEQVLFLFLADLSPPVTPISHSAAMGGPARGSAEARCSNGRRRGVPEPGLVRQHGAQCAAATRRTQLQAPFAQQQRRGHPTGEPKLPEQLGGTRAAWRRHGRARAGGGRRRLRCPSSRQLQAQRRPGGTSCRCRAWSGQLCAQQGLPGSPGLWSAIPRNTADWAPCGRPLDTTSLRRPSWIGTSRIIEVHGRDGNVTTNAGSGFFADPRDSRLDRNGSGGEDARRGTSGPVVAVLIGRASARAGTRAKRKVERGVGYIFRGMLVKAAAGEKLV